MSVRPGASRLMATCLAAVLLLAVVGIQGGAWLVDDGYIFLRYARNIDAGRGAVFNPGERVEGYSSPLWTFLLAACGAAGADLESSAVLLGLIAAFGLLAALAFCLRDMVPSWGWQADALVLGQAIFPPLVYYAMSGLDEVIFTALVACALALSLKGMKDGSISYQAATALALAVWARSEGIVLCAWVAIFFTVRHGKLDRAWLERIGRPLALAAAGVALLVGARFAYYGTIFPNTYYAKVTPDTWARLAKGWSYLLKGLPAHAPLLLLAAALGVVVRRRGSPKAARAVFLAGWIAVWWAFLVYAGGDHLPMYRFFLPCLPGIVLLAGAAWAAAAPCLGRRARAAFSVALVGCLLLASGIGFRREGEAAQRQPKLAREWASHGRWLAAATPPGTLVATTVIGAMGYFGDRPLIDMLGLADAHVAREGKVYPGAAVGHARYDTDYLMERGPDLILYYTWKKGRQRDRVFTPRGAIKKKFAYALYDFAADPRCDERYEHDVVPLDDGGLIELLRKRTFDLDAFYLVAPPESR